MLVCTGCHEPSNQEVIDMIYNDGDVIFSEICAQYDLSPADFDVAAIHYGPFIDKKEALVVLEVDDSKKSLEMSNNGDILKAFAVCTSDLSELKTPIFSVVADEVNYNIISFSKSAIDYLFVNAIDIAAGPEEFVGGLYSANSWNNIFPLDLCEDYDFLPIVIGNKIYLNTISEIDVERRLVFKFDSASGSVVVFDPEQDR